VTATDLPILFEHQRDPGSVAAGVPTRDREGFDAHWERIRADPSVVSRTIAVDGAVAGSVVSFERDGRRLVGYVLGREHWGRGIATRALEEFLAIVPERPLYGQALRHNRASIRVLEKCGFELAEETEDEATLVLFG
jgi:RimJ/RimL family protein N-acetyltransferase